MAWVWWWLVGRLMRGRPICEIERILRADACSECGSWRCPRCQFLIMGAADHHPTCNLYQPWH